MITFSHQTPSGKSNCHVIPELCLLLGLASCSKTFHRTFLYTSGLCWIGQCCLFIHKQVVLHILIITGTVCCGWCVCCQHTPTAVHLVHHALLQRLQQTSYSCNPAASATMLCNTEPNDWQGMGFWDPLLGTRDGHQGLLGTGRLAPQAGCCGSPLLSCWATASPPSPCFSSLP